MESERQCFRINLDYSHSSRKSRSWLRNVLLLKLLAFNSATVVVTCKCECVHWTDQQRPQALRADGEDTAVRPVAKSHKSAATPMLTCQYGPKLSMNASKTVLKVFHKDLEC